MLYSIYDITNRIKNSIQVTKGKQKEKKKEGVVKVSGDIKSIGIKVITKQIKLLFKNTEILYLKT